MTNCRQDAESLASAAAAQAEEQRVVQQARAGALAAAEQAAQQGQQRSDRLAWRTARLELGPARAAKLAVRQTHDGLASLLCMSCLLGTVPAMNFNRQPD